MMIGCQVGKQLVFYPRELDFLLAALHNMPDEINGKRSCLYDLTMLFLPVSRMAQCNTNARQ